MRKSGRSKIYCFKILSCGVMDFFYAVVPTERLQEMKSHYKEMGYTVQDA